MNMQQMEMSLKNLTEENVWNLSEEEVFNLIETLQSSVAKESSARYTQLIGKAFDFRSISSRRKDLKLDLIKYGFKFFPAGHGNNSLLGIYKKQKA